MYLIIKTDEVTPRVSKGGPSQQTDKIASAVKRNLINSTPRVSKGGPSQQTDKIASAVKRNLISSFRSTGIYPFCPGEVYKKLPTDDAPQDPTDAVENALTALLKEQRFGGPERPKTRKKKLDVAPGASVSTAIIEQQSEDSSDKESHISQSDESESENESDLLENEENYEVQSEVDKVQAGRYILAKFLSQRGKKTYIYVCKILEVEPEVIVIGYKSIKPSKTEFKMIDADISQISKEDIVEFLPNPASIECLDGSTKCIFKKDIKVVEV
uniref:Uncharacterized protein LOC114324648 n=1 Tax=Diabrotica virgifera virgifera TaxID=50390 RepID=A0A6P7F379_DIAVI